MKRILLSWLLLVICSLLWADIPAGKNIYLDVSQCSNWQNAPSYLIHLSRTGMTHVMKPVAGKTNLYVFTTIASTQDNINFGLAKTATTADFGGWFGDKVSSNIEWNGNCKPQWSDATPVFLVECSAGNPTGHGVALPSNDKVVDVTLIPSVASCLDSTFMVDVVVNLTGSNATLRISGDLFPKGDRVIAQCQNPYKVSVRMKWTQNKVGISQKTAFIACSDAAGQNENNRIEASFIQPELNCELTYDSVEVCNTDPTVSLTVKNTAEMIIWKDATDQEVGNTASITVNTPAANTSYTAYLYEPYIDPDNNLMVNGDFEDGYNGFLSDYEPIRDKTTNQPVVNPKWVYSNNYANGSNYGKYYMITNNAYDIQQSGIFYPVKAHGGSEFLLVDATNQGYAWYTNTAQSPQLVLHAGQTYLFSYWVACPNTGAQLLDPRAELQFVIELHMPDGTIKKANLTDVYTVGMENPVNDWYYQEVRWSCPYDCNDVTIGVKDLTQSAGGNDFCLDDIIFQPVQTSSMRLVMTEHHPVKVKNCDPLVDPCDGFKTKILYCDTTVCDTLLPYTWRGHVFEDVDSFNVVVPSKIGCGDSIVTWFRLSLTECKPDPGPVDCREVVYAKWNDVLFVNNGPTGLDGQAASYAWYRDGQQIAGATEQAYYHPAGMTGVYYAKITLKDGSVVQSCPHTFGDTDVSVTKNPGNRPATVSVRHYWVGNGLSVDCYTYEDGSVEAVKVLRL